MNTKKNVLTVILSFILLVNVKCLAQDGTFYTKSAFVLEYAPSQHLLRVDIDGDNAYDQLDTRIELSSSSVLMDSKKKKTLAMDMLRPGLRIEIQGEYYGRQIRATQISLLTDLQKKNDDATGVLEKTDGIHAVIDGQRIVLVPGTVIKGIASWKGRTYNNFNIIDLGAFAKAKGELKSDGILYADEVSVEPNLYIKGDEQVKEALVKGLNIQQNLQGGKVTMGNDTYELVKNPAIQAYVNQVGMRIIPDYLKNMPLDHPSRITFRFYVIEDPSFNAFAYPDGSVFVHTGLLKILENEAQLAAILAHEIAHVSHEHGRKQFSNDKGVNVVTSTVNAQIDKDKKEPFWKKGVEVLKGDHTEAQTQNSAIDMEGEINLNPLEIAGKIIKNNVYGKDYENQADRVGLFYMMEAGYDPREALQVWKKILQNTSPSSQLEKMGNAITSIYASHPEIKNRVRNINREIALHYYEVDFSSFNHGIEVYQEFLAKL